MLPEYARGARNAVRACLNVRDGDRVAMIKARSTEEIAAAIEEEAEAAGAGVRSWVMEDIVERPAREFPRAFAEELKRYRPTVSYYCGDVLAGELAFRHPMRQLLVDELRCRHGHMPGMNRRLMLDGMAGDYEEIYRITRQVWEIARQASQIEVATVLGTEIRATFNPAWKWIPSDGRYWEPGQWGNLPEGETFTAPWSVEGLIAAEEIGDYFTEKYGPLLKPVRLRVRDSRVVAVDGEPEALRAELEGYLAQHPNSARAGEFAIGTNVGLTELVGNFLQDEKFPGVHVAFGDPYPEETGANWDAPTHVDVLASHADVVVDGRKIMEGGRFLI
ncbi:MAG TPA: aminopeptidase [Candidatus Dormibacteraeota bacterium]